MEIKKKLQTIFGYCETETQKNFVNALMLYKNASGVQDSNLQMLREHAESYIKICNFELLKTETFDQTMKFFLKNQTRVPAVSIKEIREIAVCISYREYAICVLPVYFESNSTVPIVVLVHNKKMQKTFISVSTSSDEKAISVDDGDLHCLIVGKCTDEDFKVGFFAEESPNPIIIKYDAFAGLQGIICEWKNEYDSITLTIRDSKIEKTHTRKYIVKIIPRKGGFIIITSWDGNIKGDEKN